MTTTANTIDATWIAPTYDGEEGYYEAHMPEGGERITAADRYCPDMLGDVWHADDAHGGGYEIDTPEFHSATIRFLGGPRDGEAVS